MIIEKLLRGKMFLYYLYSNKKTPFWCFYNVGDTPGPIGNPIRYHPTTNNIQVADIKKK